MSRDISKFILNIGVMPLGALFAEACCQQDRGI
jgi:hypothetical protein